MVIKYLDKHGMEVLVGEIKKRTSNIYAPKGGAIYADAAYLERDDKPAEINSVGVWKSVSGTYTKVSSFEVGWVYNIENEFVTDANFVEGASKKVVAGTNIVVVNEGTEESPVLKFDLLAMSLSLEEYQTKKLLAPLTVLTADHTYASSADLPSAATGITDLDTAVLTDGDEAGNIYRASVTPATESSPASVTWVKLGNQTTVEGALEFLGSVAPNTPITDEEILAAFNS